MTVCKMKSSRESKGSGMKSPAMRKLARLRSEKSATAASATGEGAEAASSPTGDGGVEGAEAGPVDSLRDDAGSSCETHLIIH